MTYYHKTIRLQQILLKTFPFIHQLVQFPAVEILGIAHKSSVTISATI